MLAYRHLMAVQSAKISCQSAAAIVNRSSKGYIWTLAGLRSEIDAPAELDPPVHAHAKLSDDGEATGREREAGRARTIKSW